MYENILKRLEPVQGVIDAVLDTDTYNEIDDQFALSYMLASTERINVKAFYAAPFFNNRSVSPEDGMVKSYNEIKKLVELCGRPDMAAHTYEGSRTYLPDEHTFVDSPAARNLAELADGYTADKPLYVLAIGAITNVASALLMKPEIADKIVIVWLGGHALEWPDTREFNLIQDVAAARVVYDSKAALVILPCMGVVSAFTTTEPELNYWFMGKNALSDYLASNTIEYMNVHSKGKCWSKVIWDVTAVAYLLNDNDRFMQSKLIDAPIPEYSGHFSRDCRRHPIRYVWHINRDALMGDLIAKLTSTPT